MNSPEYAAPHQLGWGPFSPTVRGHQERCCMLRSLAALVACHCGSAHPLVLILRRAEHDPMAFAAAQPAFEALPALTRRRVISTFSRLTWPTKTGE